MKPIQRRSIARLLGAGLVTGLAGCVSPAAHNRADTESVDLVVAGDYVVTMVRGARVLRNGAVAIRDGRIIAVGPAAQIDAQYRTAERLPGTDRVVMPGLVNVHSHAAMTLLRGIADDLKLMTWLKKYIFPAEVRFVDEEFVRVGTELACAEMIRGGTTTFVDMYYYPDVIAEVAERCGLRAFVSATVIGQKSPDAQNAAAGLKQARAFIGRWKDRHERITPILGPHSVYTLTLDQLVQVRALANELEVPVSIHISESQFEVTTTRERYGATPIELLESRGFFSGPTIGAHSIYPTEAEIGVLAERGVGIAHCPSSNMKISSGVAPITALLKKGINVGFGTDGAATNNDLDLFEEMRLGAFLQKVTTGNPEVLPAPQVLEMATAGGARAIGLGNELGQLAPGFRADVLQVGLDDPHFTPLYDVTSHLVYVADEQDVETVIVSGQVLLRDGKLQTLDPQRIQLEAEQIAARISEGLGVAR